MRTKEVDVSIRKSYDWDCPRCGQHNIQRVWIDDELNHLVCHECGAEINFISQVENCGEWIYKEI